MKKIMSAFIALLYFSPSFSQKLEIGINNAYAFNTSPLNKKIHTDKPNAVINYKQGGTNPYFDLNAQVHLKDWSVGLSMGLAKLSYFISYDYWDERGYHTWAENRSITEIAYPVQLFTNRNFTSGRFTFYTGASVGFLHSALPERKNALSAGFRFGGTCFFFSHIGINIDLQGNYLYFYGPYENISLVQVPLTFGLHYRF